MKSKIFFVLAGIVLIVSLVYLSAEISVVFPSLSPFYTLNNSVELNFSITGSNLANLIYNWNSTNFTIYNNSLVLMYNFDNLSSIGENSTSILDSSNYGNNVTTISGAIWNSSGKYGGAYQFDGINDYLSVGDKASLSFPNNAPFAISLWIYPNKLNPTDWDKVLGKGINTDYEYIFRIYQNVPKFTLFTLGGGDVCSISANTNLSTNMWQHITIVYNTTNCSYYINGRLDGMGGRTGVSSAGDGSQPLLIGSAYDGAGQGYFNGSIDEVRIWNRSLNANEIYQNYISNFKKYNSTQWYFYVNQSKNATTGLDNSTYTYQLFSVNSSGSFNSTEQRTIIIGQSSSQGNSESSSEWWMFQKYLNHTAWDGVPFTVIGGLNIMTYSTGNQVQSSPAVANGYVYIGGVDKKVYQLNASNVSQLIASYTTGGIVYSSPAVANGYVYIGSNDQKIYQLNASNVSNLISTYATRNQIQSSPAVANGYVYIGSDENRLYQLNASNVSKLIASYLFGAIAYPSPAIANGYVYMGSYDKKIYQLNASNVSQLIASYTTPYVIASSPAVANGYVYIGGSDGNVYQLNASNVSLLIANYTTSNVIGSSPAVANGYVYIGSGDNNVYQLNASNISNLISKYNTGGYIYSSPAVANGYVYIGSNNNKIYQLNASNVSQLIASYTTGGSVASSPAVANGYVYFGSFDKKVYQLNASNISLPNPDTTPPVINFTTPENNTDVNGNVTIGVTASDLVGMKNVTFEYKNSTTGYTVFCSDTSSPYSCIWNTRLFSEAAEGYDIRATAYDTSNNNASMVLHLSIDRSIPIIDALSVTYPSGQSSVRYGQNILFGVNVSDGSGSGINYTWINPSIIGLSALTMNFSSGSKSSGQWSYWDDNLTINTTSPSGNYGIKPYIYDLATPSVNVRNSDLFIVLVDNIAPTYSQQQSYGPTYNNEELTFSIRVSEPIIPYGIESYIFSTNSTGAWVNDSLVELTSNRDPLYVTKTVTTGNYSYRFYLFDDAGNMNATTISNFEVYGDRPVLTVLPQSPADATSTANTTINFSYMYTSATASNCSLYIGLNLNQTTNLPSNNTILSFSPVTFPVGTYSWSVRCTDSSDNEIYSGVSRALTILENTTSAESNQTIRETNANSAADSGSYIIEQKGEGKGLKIKIFILPNKTVTRTITEDRGTGIKEIRLKAKNQLSGEIFIVAYNETPDFCSINYKNKYKLYKVFDFNETINQTAIDSGTLKIGILKNWTYSNNISEIKFVKCSPVYEEVSSSYDSETNTEGIYNVYINGFSTYAILGTIKEKINNSEEITKTKYFSKFPLWILIILAAIILILIKILSKNKRKKKN
jgi:outer membrane protein assembly factor BamB